MILRLRTPFSDHKINYPHSNESLSCRDQIRTLAWVASSCTGLVDSIFATHPDEVLQIAPAVPAPSGQAAAPDSREPSPGDLGPRRRSPQFASILTCQASCRDHQP